MTLKALAAPLYITGCPIICTGHSVAVNMTWTLFHGYALKSTHPPFGRPVWYSSMGALLQDYSISVLQVIEMCAISRIKEEFGM